MLRNEMVPFLTNLRVSFIKAEITIAFLVCIITEFLSFFKQITFINLLGAWAITLVVAVCIVLRSYGFDFATSGFATSGFAPSLRAGLRSHLGVEEHVASAGGHHERVYLLLIIACVVLIILPLLFLAIYYPPCNIDSLAYHLPRIEHWIQNKSVAHYFTNDIRQLYTPPLSEFIQLQMRVLSDTDFWSNLVQFFSLLGCISIISLIIQILGMSYKYQVLGVVLILCIPMSLLQATTTQTDLLAAFFLCAFVYFGFRLTKLDKIYYSDALWCSLALALGFFTKQTVAVFAFPFALWFSVLIFRRSWKAACGIGLIGLFFMILINLPFVARNYLLCGNVLGEQRMVQMMQNQKMSGRFFVSNLIRNLSMHMAFPLANRIFNKMIIEFHKKVLNVNPEDPAITFSSETYEPFFCINEDASGNFLFIFLLIFILFYAVFNFKILLLCNQYTILCYFCSLLVGYLIFTYIFKWQPWITRLDLPWCVISVPFVVYTLKRIFSAENPFFSKLFLYFIVFLSGYWMVSFAAKNVWILLASLGLLMIVYFISVKSVFKKDHILGSFILSAFLFSFPYVYFNPGRPLLCRYDKVFASREFKYFAANQAEYEKYLFIADLIKEYKIEDVYIISPSCINEYRLWVVLKSKINNMPHISHLNGLTQNYFGEVRYKYFAIVSYCKDCLALIPSDAITYFKSLGCERDPLFIIVLKNIGLR